MKFLSYRDSLINNNMIICDEFEEEISLRKISQSTYKNDRGKEYPMFELTPYKQNRYLLKHRSDVSHDL